MEKIKQFENIFEDLRGSHITEEEAQQKIKNNIITLNREEARNVMKKLDRYQYEDRLRKTVYAVCPMIYDLIKECD